MNGACFAAFVAAGQTCVSAKRILVERSVYEAFEERLVAKVAGLKMGDPAAPATMIGPLVSGGAVDAAEAHVDAAVAAGAVALVGGRRANLGGGLAGGSFFAPTVLGSVSQDMDCYHDEAFAPVVTLTPFADEKDAVALANANKHGLGAGVWTRDVAKAHRVAAALRAGVVWCNAHHRNAPDAPWGGFGASGVGRENGAAAQDEYTAAKTTIIRTSDAKEDWFADPNARYS